jgi:protein-arginine kinase activator protein McsA
MKCERCGQQDADVHFTVIRDSVAATEHLCQDCSGEARNEDLPAAIKSLYDFMLNEPGALTEAEREVVRRLSKAMDEAKQDTDPEQSD